MIRPRNIGKILLLTLAVGLTGFIDYAAACGCICLEAVSNEFYFLPVFMGALWFGPKGGLLTSVGSVYLGLPAVLLNGDSSVVVECRYLLETVALVSFGFVAPLLKRVRSLRFPVWVRQSLKKGVSRTPQPLPSFLLCLEEPENASKAAHALLRQLELKPKARITVMGVLHDPQQESFESFEAFYQEVQREDTAIRNAISEAMDTLIKGGVSEDRLQSRVYRTQAKSTIRGILGTQQFKRYETILLGSHKLKGSEVPLTGRSYI